MTLLFVLIVSCLLLNCCHKKQEKKILKYKPPVRDAYLRTQRTRRKSFGSFSVPSVISVVKKSFVFGAGVKPALFDEQRIIGLQIHRETADYGSKKW